MTIASSSASSGVFRCRDLFGSEGAGNVERSFPSFLPMEIERVRDRATRRLARRIERLPVTTSISEKCIMSSCVRPVHRNSQKPVVLLHGFDSSLLEWRYTLPLLEDAGLEAWAVDVLGWGFSDLSRHLPPCNVNTKREHLYQFWRLYVKQPMLLVGPSLGAAVAIDFAIAHPEAVSELILIDASVYAEGTGSLSKLPKYMAYAAVSLLKSMPLRLVASLGSYNSSSLSTLLDRTTVDILHSSLPWWEDATVNFMLSGGYNVIDHIKQVERRTLVVWGEDDRIISRKFAHVLHQELQNSVLRIVPDCGHFPHIEKPKTVAKLIIDFSLEKVKQQQKPNKKPPCRNIRLNSPLYIL